jgi:hypothetical protein
MVYNTQDYHIFGLCPLSIIVKNMEFWKVGLFLKCYVLRLPDNEQSPIIPRKLIALFHAQDYCTFGLCPLSNIVKNMAIWKVGLFPKCYVLRLPDNEQSPIIPRKLIILIHNNF